MQFVDRYVALRHRYYSWRHGLETAQKAALAAAFACLTGLMAQVRVVLPFTPVPITGQVFAVLLAGVALGAFWGALGQWIYIGVGVAGVPWFQGMTGGMRVLAGPTGGYIFGFVIAAAIIGLVVDTKLQSRKARFTLPLMLISVGVIYLFGMAWLGLYLHVGVEKAFMLGVLPFIGVDIVKAFLAAGIGSTLMTKQPYGPEIR